ncbi:hypothetical protein THIOSC15_1930004 [uncultured Thiomicrorhabdus sp.]
MFNNISYLQCHWNKGNFEFTGSLNHGIKLDRIYSDIEASKLRLVDINSDGLADLCEYDETNKTYSCRLNYGVNGFIMTMAEARYVLENVAKDDTVSFIDTNQNGITEACLSKADEKSLVCKEPSSQFAKETRNKSAVFVSVR